jgi:Gliding motility associated protein GldN
MKLRLFLSITLTFCLATSNLMGQEDSVTIRGEYNPNSIRPVRTEDIMFRMRVWSWMDLREKVNSRWNAQGNEIVKLLLEGAMDEIDGITAYRADSIRNPEGDFLDEDIITPQQVQARMLIPVEDTGDLGGMSIDDLLGGAGLGGAEDSITNAGNQEASPYYQFDEILLLELCEDFIIDKRRSRGYWDIQSISLVLNPTQTRAATTAVIARFKYKDVVAYMKKFPKQARWYNASNPGQKVSFSEAFDLRMFDARPIRYSNPNNGRIEDVQGVEGLNAILASQRFKNKLLEYEHNLWEY